MDDVRAIEAGREEAFVFLADSRMRDRVAYPTPSEYEIAFNAPFRNVVGVDLLDATLPRAEYQVESGSNSLRFAVTSEGGAETWHVATVPPGDYNVPQLVEALNVAFDVGGGSGPPITVAPASDPYERTNRLLFSRARPFRFDMAASSIRYIIGFGNPVIEGDQDYEPDPSWRPYETGADDIFVAAAVPALDAADALVGPAVAVDFESVGGAGGRTVRQRFLALATGPITEVAVNVSAPSGAALSVVVTDVATGAEVAAGDTETIADAREPTTVAMTSATDLVAGREYAVVFASLDAPEIARAPVNFPDGSDAAGRADVYGGGGWQSLGTDDQLCVSVRVSTSGYRMLSPGVVQLTGERYVIVRCPEIESHMYRDRASERFHSGLGIVKLTGYGYNEQRYDFVSFPVRKFHPIGKLRKLTIRIEKANGTLYDAHGVDHVLMMVIRYRTAPIAPATGNDAQQHAQQQQSTLNPAYSSDYRQYAVDELGRRVERAMVRPPESFGSFGPRGASGRA